MISTTMHFCPGGQILKSKDLLHRKQAAYVYEHLEETPQRRMKDAAHIYGKGMWAASLRFHKGIFYVCFVANDTHKTYLYRAKQIEGPWKMNEIQGFYHDCSLLFDEEAAPDVMAEEVLWEAVRHFQILAIDCKNISIKKDITDRDCYIFHNKL